MRANYTYHNAHINTDNHNDPNDYDLPHDDDNCDNLGYIDALFRASHMSQALPWHSAVLGNVGDVGG